MDAREIKDEKSLLEWLEKRPKEDAIFIAERAAYRVLPLIFSSHGGQLSWEGEDLDTIEKDFTLPTDENIIEFLRIPLTLRGLSVSSEDEIEDYFASASLAPPFFRLKRGDPTHVFLELPRVFIAESAASTVVSAVNYAAQSYGMVLDSRYIWGAVNQDHKRLSEGIDPTMLPLWPNGPPDLFTKADQETRTIWAQEPEHWEFWTRWWDSVIKGEPLPDQLLHDIALIPDAIWKQGPGPVAKEIRRIEAKFAEKENSDANEVAKLPPAPPERVHTVKAAMERNRESLPPTFDAIEGLLLLEIERLQRSNDHDEHWRRQLGVYLALFEAVQGLRASLPASGAISTQQAEKSESLLRVYFNKFSELPRAKADEVVDGTWNVGKGVVKVGLITSTSLLAVSYGLPALAAVAIGSLVFAPKESTEIIKSAKELLPKANPP